jgi:hypothetical protein
MTFVMRKKLIALTLILLSPAFAGAADVFLTAIEDVPLAPNLVEQATGGMVFDSPTGRIVEAVASGTGTADQVTAFYAQTLPQLGWSTAGKMIFKRETETLRITVDPAPQKGAASKDAIIVRFNLAPDNH